MLLTWIVLGGIAIAMYIIIYKYEKKMNDMQDLIEANKEKLGEHHDRITKNHERSSKNHEKLDDHHDRITSNHERSVKNHERSKKNHERSTKNHETLKEHNNHISQMWVTIPKRKSEKED